MKTLIVTIIKYIIGWYFGTKLQQNKTRKEIKKLEKELEELTNEQEKLIVKEDKTFADIDRINELGKLREKTSTKIGKLSQRQRKNIRIEIE